MPSQFSVSTRSHSDMVDVTSQVQAEVSGSGIENGVCTAYVRHTTAGITINEGADPAVVTDILAQLDRMVPWDNNYRHTEGNSAAHVKTSMMGSSVQIPVADGKLQLGTWQSVFLAEFDGPRTRKVMVQVLPG